MKRVLFMTLLCAAMVLSLFSTGIFAATASAEPEEAPVFDPIGDDGVEARENIVAYGPCGKGEAELTWVVYRINELGDKVLAIYGSGSTNDSRPWSDYKNDIVTVLFADTVLNVCPYAFDDYPKLSSVRLPANLTTIGGYAFRSCPSLRTLALPGGVTDIASYAFSDYYARLYTTTGSETAKALSRNGTYFCVSGNDNVKLKHVIAEGEITGTKAKAYNSEITEAVIPAGVTEIEGTGFYECTSLQRVEMANTVTAIGNSAFRGCTSLTALSLSANLTSISGYAFGNCDALSVITLPDGVTDVASNAFYDYYARLSVTLGSETAKALSRNGTYFCTKGYDSVKLKYIFADGEITGMQAKAYDSKITGAALPSGVTVIVSSGFSGCAALQSVELPDTVTAIEAYAFSGCASLSSVTLSANLRSIGSNAFNNCTALEALVLPDGLTSIDSNAFTSCTARRYVTPGSDTAKTLSYNNMYFCVSGCDSVKLKHVLTDGEITGTKARAYDSGITEAAIPEGVTIVESTGFYNCTSLRRVEMADTVTAIESSAFSECTSLSSATLSANLTSIGRNAFSNCTALESLVLPDGLTSINTGAFTSCTARRYVTPGSVTAKTLSSNNMYFCVSGCDSVKLKHVLTDGKITGTKAKAYNTEITCAVIPDGVTVVENSGFSGCAALQSIELADTVTTIEASAFSGCASLSSVTLSANLTTIGGNAFQSCAALGTLTIPSGVTSIANNAFPKSHETLIVFCGSEGLSWAKRQNYPSETEAAEGSYRYVPVHTWGESEYAWAEDGSAVTASRVCVYDESHAESETAKAARELTKSPTMTEPGEHTCTSQSFTNPAFAAQTVVLDDVPALGTLCGLRLPSRLSGVGAEAFRDNDAIQYALLPVGCASIGEKAFADCDELLYIRIPATVTTIAEDAFDGCPAELVIDRLG